MFLKLLIAKIKAEKPKKKLIISAIMQFVYTFSLYCPPPTGASVWLAIATYLL